MSRLADDGRAPRRARQHRWPSRRIRWACGALLIGVGLSAAEPGGDPLRGGPLTAGASGSRDVPPQRPPAAPSIRADAETLSERYAAFERMDDPAVRAWVDDERAAAARLFAEMPARPWFRTRFAALATRIAFGLPDRQGRQFVSSSTDADGRVTFALDPEPHAASPRLRITEDADRIPVRALQLAPNERLAAYARAAAGATTQTWRIRDLATGADTGTTITDARPGTPLIWSADSRTLFYVRPGAPTDAIVRWSLDSGTSDAVFSAPDAPRLSLSRSDDGFIILGSKDGRRSHSAWHFEQPSRSAHSFDHSNDRIGALPQGAAPSPDRAWRDRSSFRLSVSRPAGHATPDPATARRHAPPLASPRLIASVANAQLTFVAKDADRFLFLIGQDDTPARLVSIAPGEAPANWRTIITSSNPDEALEQVIRLDAGRATGRSSARSTAGFATRWAAPGRHVVRLHNRDGRIERELALPGIGTVIGLSAGSSNDLYLQFSSYLTPTGVYHYDVRRNALRLVRSPRIPFDGAAYETAALRVSLPSRFESTSGARTSQLWMTSRRNQARDADAPLLLYVNGYRGVPQAPAFAFTVAGWLDAGGRFAVLHLPPPGARTHEEDVDEIAGVLAALTRDRLARPERIVVHGGAAHGGLLVATALLRHPDLAAASWTASGPMDLLALERQSAPPAWASEYGELATASGRARRHALSPLEAIASSASIPAISSIGSIAPSSSNTSIASNNSNTAITARVARVLPPNRWPSHVLTIDDPAVPAWHSHKFLAALNAAHAVHDVSDDAPRRAALLRQEPPAPRERALDAMLDERADVYALFAARLDWDVEKRAARTR